MKKSFPVVMSIVIGLAAMVFLSGCPNPVDGNRKILMIYPKCAMNVDTTLIKDGSVVGVGEVISTRNIGFTLKNEGDLDITISGASRSGDGEFDFVSNPAPTVLKKGESTDLILSFTAAMGHYGAAATVFQINNDSNNLTNLKFTVSGTVIQNGIVAVLPDQPRLYMNYEDPTPGTTTMTTINSGDASIHLGTVNATTPETMVTFNVYNKGYQDLVINSLSLDSGASPEITIRFPTNYTRIMPGFSDQIILKLAKGATVGAKSATVRLVTNDGGAANSNFVFTVQGTVQ